MILYQYNTSNIQNILIYFWNRCFVKVTLFQYATSPQIRSSFSGMSDMSAVEYSFWETAALQRDDHQSQIFKRNRKWFTQNLKTNAWLGLYRPTDVQFYWHKNDGWNLVWPNVSSHVLERNGWRGTECLGVLLSVYNKANNIQLNSDVFNQTQAVWR